MLCKFMPLDGQVTYTMCRSLNDVSGSYVGGSQSIRQSMKRNSDADLENRTDAPCGIRTAESFGMNSMERGALSLERAEAPER